MSKMSAKTSAPVFYLNDSNVIPAIGFGTVAFEDKTETVKATVLKALQVGYRHIDTASKYKSEVGIGEALREAFADGLVKREDVFVTTKIASDQLHVDEIILACRESLSNLQLEYVDLYLIHWPYRIKPGRSVRSTNIDDYLPLDMKATWEQMEKLVELRLTKSIGVSNFYVKVLQKVLATAKIPPAVNQVELHPLWHQDKVRSYCKRKNIHVTAWSPIGAPGAVYGFTSVLDNPVLKEIAEKHGKSVPQISIRWAYEAGASPIPKSFNEIRMTENFDVWDFKLTDEDHEKIKRLEQHCISAESPITLQFQSTPWRTFAEFWDDNEE